MQKRKRKNTRDNETVKRVVQVNNEKNQNQGCHSRGTEEKAEARGT